MLKTLKKCVSCLLTLSSVAARVDSVAKYSRSACRFVSQRGAAHSWTPFRAARIIARPNAPVAQLDRVAASEAAGRWFESSRARHLTRGGRVAAARYAPTRAIASVNLTLSTLQFFSVGCFYYVFLPGTERALGFLVRKSHKERDENEDPGIGAVGALAAALPCVVGAAPFTIFATRLGPTGLALPAGAIDPHDQDLTSGTPAIVVLIPPRTSRTTRRPSRAWQQADGFPSTRL